MDWRDQVVLVLALLSLFGGISLGMALNLWLWRRRCAPRQRRIKRATPRHLPPYYYFAEDQFVPFGALDDLQRMHDALKEDRDTIPWPPKRTLEDRVRDLIRSHERGGELTEHDLIVRLRETVDEWRSLGCPDRY